MYLMNVCIRPTFFEGEPEQATVIRTHIVPELVAISDGEAPRGRAITRTRLIYSALHFEQVKVSITCTYRYGLTEVMS
jgi:hypothetical protein